MPYCKECKIPSQYGVMRIDPEPFQLVSQFDIKALGKNIEWGKEEGDENFLEENKDLENWGGEDYQVEGNYIHP